MRYLEMIGNRCERVIIAEPDTLPPTDGEWVASEREGNPGWTVNDGVWTPRPDSERKVRPEISVRDFKEIVGMPAIQRIYQRPDMGAFMAYVTATGDIDRSDPAFGQAMDALLVDGDITQTQYDQAYPEGLR